MKEKKLGGGRGEILPTEKFGFLFKYCFHLVLNILVV